MDVAKKYVWEGFRAVLDLEEPYWVRHKSLEEKIRAMRREADEILTSIKRHVDFLGEALVEEVGEMQCEHCEARWTERSNEYNGGCCDKDEENNPAKAVA